VRRSVFCTKAKALSFKGFIVVGAAQILLFTVPEKLIERGEEEGKSADGKVTAKLG